MFYVFLCSFASFSLLLRNNHSDYNMKSINIAFVSVIIAMMAATGCSNNGKSISMAVKDSTSVSTSNDSTIYGLACDGCTDTIMVLLRDIHEDPDTFNILNASRQQRVIGHPKIGDEIAIVLAPEGNNVAAIVIDIDQLKGSWCYKVTPKLRERADIDEAMKKKLLEQMPDTILKRLLEPREFGIQLKNDSIARTIGYVYRSKTSDEESPVEFPVIKRYRKWFLSNGQLVLNEMKRDTTGNEQLVSSDTAEIITMLRDTLVLRFADGERGYYRQQE